MQRKRYIITKEITTLVADIEDVLLNGVDNIPEEKIKAFGEELSNIIANKLLKQPPREFTLRMSNIGGKCARKLWLEKNHPEAKEPLMAHTINKFIYGDILESYAIFLADVAGHKVEGRQDVQELAGIKGHRDCIIDGVVVDVKSASKFGFEKFKNHLVPETDSFAYLPQLNGYVHSGQDDPIVTDKTKGAFFVIEKESGHMHLDIQPYDPNVPWEEAYEARKEVVNSPEIPDRAFEDEPDGYTNKNKEFVPNGNKRLKTECGYCHVKNKCWPGLRTFVGAGYPKYLTHVEKEPRLLEVTQ